MATATPKPAGYVWPRCVDKSKAGMLMKGTDALQGAPKPPARATAALNARTELCKEIVVGVNGESSATLS